MNRPTAAVLIMLITAFALAVSAEPTQDVQALLSRMHEASKNADPAYFDLFADDAVFFGTDLWERWTKDEFEALYRPYMESGKGWEFKMRDRRIDIQPCGTIALFDEVLFSESYGPCRGTGAARLDDGEWKLVRYHLDITIPNGVVDEVVPITWGNAAQRLRVMHIDVDMTTVESAVQAIRSRKPDLVLLEADRPSRLSDIERTLVETYATLAPAVDQRTLLRANGTLADSIRVSDGGIGNQMLVITYCCDQPQVRIALARSETDAAKTQLADMTRWPEHQRPHIVIRGDRIETVHPGVAADMKDEVVAGVAIQSGTVVIPPADPLSE